MSRTRSREFLVSVGLVAGALLIVLVGYAFLISPAKSDAATYTQESDELQRQLVDLEAKLARVENAEADLPQLYRLAKAAPTDLDIPGVVLELTSTASKSGVKVRSVQVGELADGEGYAGVPFNVVVGGDFATVTNFIEQIRTLVVVRSEKLRSKGNLYLLEEFAISEGEQGLPSLDATLTLTATGPEAAGSSGSGTAISPGGGSDPEGDQPEGDAPSEGNGG